MIIVSSNLTDIVKISNKLIIYLDDGTVISCTDHGINDNVDDVATSAYRRTIKSRISGKKNALNRRDFYVAFRSVPCFMIVLNHAELSLRKNLNYIKQIVT